MKIDVKKITNNLELIEDIIWQNKTDFLKCFAVYGCELKHVSFTEFKCVFIYSVDTMQTVCYDVGYSDLQLWINQLSDYIDLTKITQNLKLINDIIWEHEIYFLNAFTFNAMELLKTSFTNEYCYFSYFDDYYNTHNDYIELLNLQKWMDKQ